LTNSGANIFRCGSRIDIPYSAAISRSFPLSIEFWAKLNSRPPTSVAGGPDVCPITSLDNNWYGGVNRSGWVFYCSTNGHWTFRLGTSSGYLPRLDATSGNAVIGTWQHIVATYDGLTVKLYVDGVPAGSQNSDAAVTGWLPNSQSAIRIGGTELNG